MFQLIAPATVKLMHINVRTEKHGPADVDAFDLDFQIGGENQKVLALLHPQLCAALCFNEDDDGGQETVEGVPPHLPNIRFPKLAEALPWTDEATGVDLTVIYGLGDDLSNIKLEGGKAATKKFSIEEGGSASVSFSYSVAGYPDGVIDKLRKKLKQDVTITMVRPDKLRQDAIDGTGAEFAADHPDLPGPSAEDLFAAGAGGPEDDPSEGGDPDAAGGEGPEPEPDLNPLREPAATSTRTARGREATRKALAEGAAAHAAAGAQA
jgi:hypothetical protein